MQSIRRAFIRLGSCGLICASAYAEPTIREFYYCSGNIHYKRGPDQN